MSHPAPNCSAAFPKQPARGARRPSASERRPCSALARTTVRPVVLVAFAVLHLATHASAADPNLVVTPAEVALHGHFEQAQLLVRASAASPDAAGLAEDLTRKVKFATSNADVVSVTNTGRLLAVGDGMTTVKITGAGGDAEVAVTVTGCAAAPQIDYLKQINPIISKAGCNMGACHASQYGKGGFKLSVFAFDPEEDYAAIVRDRQQRRVNFLNPGSSLFLQKPSMQVPHGGSLRIPRESVDYQILEAWLACGAPGPSSKTTVATGIAVTPAQRVGIPGMTQQLRVEALYSDGTRRDVTAWSRFDSMDEAAFSVDNDGYITALDRGQAPILVRYEGHAEICMCVVPYADSVELAGWTNNNFVDELAAAKFRELGIEPSGLCDDATFVRRAFLDAIGTLPTIAEATAFIDSNDPQKREKLVDRLLGLTGDPALDIYNDQYAAYWTLKWSDLLKNSSATLRSEQGMWALHNWIRESLRTNKPFDAFVRELVTAKGSSYMSGPANYFLINGNTTELAESTAQLFLGVRLECAKCHHHPFENYSQGDYYSFAAFFSRTASKNSEEFGIFGRERVVLVKSSGDVRHPKTNKVLEPKPLGGESVDHALDRRIPLAAWLTSPDNRLFSRSVVNRYVGYLLGRGLVEPLDDMRSTNPPTNVALMDALSAEFVESGFNLKHLIRTIMVSRLYQLDSQPTPANASDDRFYSHFKVKRLAAEPLLDAVDAVTGVQTKFRNLPAGTRAIELPDAEYPDYFLNTFAKPKRASVCECERSPDENLAQALHMLNGDILAAKISDKDGRLKALLDSKRPHEEIVTELYLATLIRRPSQAELDLSRKFLAESPSPQECYEDLFWALLNSKQFLFVR